MFAHNDDCRIRIKLHMTEEPIDVERVREVEGRLAKPEQEKRKPAANNEKEIEDELDDNDEGNHVEAETSVALNLDKDDSEFCYKRRDSIHRGRRDVLGPKNDLGGAEDGVEGRLGD